MKRIILSFALVGIFATSFAQNATLTKEETVNYINKKLAECHEHKKTPSNGKLTPTIDNQSISLSDAGLITKTLKRSVTLSGADCPNGKLYDYEKFNAAHIVSIEADKNYDESEAVGTIKLTLLSNTGHQTSTVEAYTRVLMGRCTDWKEVDRSEAKSSVAYLYYLKGDPTNFNKVKKAFEYLRDLVKAEDDPFGG